MRFILTAIDVDSPKARRLHKSLALAPALTLAHPESMKPQFDHEKLHVYQASLNFVAWARTEFAVTADDVFTNVNPMFFDNSVFDFYGSIMNGASLVPFDAATMKDPYQVLQRIGELRSGYRPQHLHASAHTKRSCIERRLLRNGIE